MLTDALQLWKVCRMGIIAPPNKTAHLGPTGVVCARRMESKAIILAKKQIRMKEKHLIKLQKRRDRAASDYDSARVRPSSSPLMRHAALSGESLAASVGIQVVISVSPSGVSAQDRGVDTRHLAPLTKLVEDAERGAQGESSPVLRHAPHPLTACPGLAFSGSR